MKYSLLIGILSMTMYVLPAHIMQSNLNEKYKEELINLAAYIIEEYDPKMEASASICLSNKKNSGSVLDSTSSIKPQTETTIFFEEKVYNSQNS